MATAVASTGFSSRGGGGQIHLLEVETHTIGSFFDSRPSSAHLRSVLPGIDDPDKEAKGRHPLPGTGTITGADGIDGRLVTWDDCNPKLRSPGILGNAHNFLAF